MTYLLQYRRYALPFKGPIRTAHGPWVTREGLIVRMEDETGGVGYGEAAPIPGFGPETTDADVAAMGALGDRVDAERLAAVPANLGCLRNALAAAVPRNAEGQSGGRTATSARWPTVGAITPMTYLPVAALLPAGRAALERVGPQAEAGFRTFKWKVGVEDVDDELVLLDDLCAALPGGAKLRLDANGAWDRRRAERWLERCAERPVEFVEQPCFAGAAEGITGRSKVEDVLLGLAEDYPTPVALDESLVNEGDLERWLGAGWPGVYVVKPLLLGDLDGALARLAAAKAKVVFSSALETAVGAKRALQAAFAWRGELADSMGSAGSPQAGSGRDSPPQVVRALGFGVWPLFADARFDGPASAPFIRWEDVERINPEALWTALS